MRWRELREMLLLPCGDEEALHLWVETFLGMRVPRRGICAGHVGPFEYLKRAYFEPGEDLVVWAPRGGGKTRLGAAATMLDMLHKPGCQVRILGGSMEQSEKMWEHLMPAMEPFLEEVSEKGARARRVELATGSSCRVLTQSEKSVRGLRVQKLRCDEVELFDKRIWEAAQLTTKGLQIAGGSNTGEENAGETPASRGVGQRLTIAGTIEALSTFHKPFGLMGKIVDEAEGRGARVLKWCLMEVLERCPAERECGSCALWEECRGVAKGKEPGFVSIEDAIKLKKRVSVEMWEAEMLCRRPRARDCVFPTFDMGAHVVEELAGGAEGEVTLSLDFGFAAPFVCLWIVTDGAKRTHVVDEYVQAQRTLGEHVEQMGARKWGGKRITCDPAGSSRSDQTAMSNVQFLRDRGYAVKFRKSLIPEGLEMIRAALRPASGEGRLFIHRRCERLIKAMRGYHYAAGGSELPIKDGEHDHLVDALRYYFINTPLRNEGMVASRRY